MAVVGLDAQETLVVGAAAGGVVLGLLLGWLLTRVTSVLRLREELARTGAALDGERRAGEERVAALRLAEDTLRQTFGALSAEALRHNNRAFLELARAALAEQQRGATLELGHRQEAIGALVRPLQQALERVDESLRSVETQRVGAYEALRVQVQSLHGAQERLHSETAQLAKALRAPTVRGRWGELQLRRVVELAGMSEHCDFREQQTLDGDNGRGRPDLVVQLPAGRVIAVDAKVPLTGYLASLEAANDADAAAKLAQHGREVRAHVAALSSREYAEKLQTSPELVVMFLPGEAMFSAALRADPGLIEYAAERRIVLASPTTLISLLRAVAHGWREERLAENAELISRMGRELYERARSLAEHFDGLRRGLEGAVDGYNRAVSALENRVLATARRFRELGAGGSEEIPAVRTIEKSTRESSREASDRGQGPGGAGR